MISEFKLVAVFFLGLIASGCGVEALPRGAQAAPGMNLEGPLEAAKRYAAEARQSALESSKEREAAEKTLSEARELLSRAEAAKMSCAQTLARIPKKPIIRYIKPKETEPAPAGVGGGGEVKLNADGKPATALPVAPAAPEYSRSDAPPGYFKDGIPAQPPTPGAPGGVDSNNKGPVVDVPVMGPTAPENRK